MQGWVWDKCRAGCMANVGLGAGPGDEKYAGLGGGLGT